MGVLPEDKKRKILAELDEKPEQEEFLRTMECLDKYEVSPPDAQSTEAMIAFLKPVFAQTVPAMRERPAKPLPALGVWQLLLPQARLLGKWFVLGTALLLLAGLTITNAADGNTLKFLANAAPALGILTLLYEFRAKHSGVSELEASCPYSPVQLATARLMVILGFDILLCLAATPLVSYWQGRVLGMVVMSWLAPLLFLLGVALFFSLRLGITGGCLVSAAVWALQLTAGKGESVFSLLLTGRPGLLADMAGLLTGAALVAYSCKHWNAAVGDRNGQRN